MASTANVPEPCIGTVTNSSPPWTTSRTRASTSSLMRKKVASREPQSCTMTSFTRLDVVSGPGVSSRGSPVSEAARSMVIEQSYEGPATNYHITGQEQVTAHYFPGMMAGWPMALAAVASRSSNVTSGRVFGAGDRQMQRVRSIQLEPKVAHKAFARGHVAADRTRRCSVCTRRSIESANRVAAAASFKWPTLTAREIAAANSAAPKSLSTTTNVASVAHSRIASVCMSARNRGRTAEASR